VFYFYGVFGDEPQQKGESFFIFFLRYFSEIQYGCFLQRKSVTLCNTID
jgi:hypothetical protein